MEITLEEFISQYCITNDADYPVYIYHSVSEENVYAGPMDQIPEELLECRFCHWEYDEFTHQIGFNVGNWGDEE